MNKNEIPDFILTVRFFKTANDVEPVRDWLRTLPIDAKKAIGEDIKTVQYGWPIGMPVVRKLETGLWEVRSHLKDGIARVLFTVLDDVMILLHGFIKKSQKTPTEELETARKRKKLLQITK
jgi:phage-related protein